MIKVKHLDKFFNKNKNNEIHVINDINLQLEEGLVVLLGPSGSGKTTLLNVLGGLDKVGGGEIQFGDDLIKKYDSATWDKIRNQRIGYIFQNYNLLANISVYDNISLTLNMIGIYEKEELDKRIEYVLEKVGMLNYKKRKPSQLSGGQQQRVAIARALAKNPDVIIADEPTGNLDSKNTHDIMRIIKSISKTKLVILVTHEVNLANIYSDRIISLADGKIVADVFNESSEYEGVKHETDIYLKDLNKKPVLDSEHTKLSVYSDVTELGKLDIRLILKNNTFYLDLGNQKNHKVQVINHESEIKLLDKKYDKKEIKQEEINFDLSEIVETKELSSKNSVISFKDSVKMAFGRMKLSSKVGKLFYVGFAVGAILIAVAISLLSSVVLATQPIQSRPIEQVVSIEKGLNSYGDIMGYTEDESIDFVLNITNLTVSIDLPLTYQSQFNYSTLYLTPLLLGSADTSQIILGEAPDALNEVLLSKASADLLLLDQTVLYSGIKSYEDLMEFDFYSDGYGSGVTNNYFKVVGIIDDNNVTMYLDEALLYQLVTEEYGIYELFADSVDIERGTMEDNHFIQYENVLIDLDNPHTKLFYEEPIEVSGTFTSADSSVPNALITLETAKKAYFERYRSSQTANIQLFTSNKEMAMIYLTAQGETPVDLLKESLKVFREGKIIDGLSAITFNVVVLAASAISYFFIIRSSLLSRIYEISVYRSLGVSKGDIRKIFITEILLVTTLTSLIAYCLTSLLILRIGQIAGSVSNGMDVSVLSFFAGLILIYLVNLVSGLIPVSNLLRKTPSEITSKYDF